MPSSTSSFEREPDPFGVLGVPSSATPKEIRAAYLALAARYHPDQHHGNPLAELAGARMAEINHAYALLSGSARRGKRASTGAHARSQQAAAERQMRSRFFKGALLLLAVPLVFRTGAILIRVVVALLRLLVEGLASLRGPRLPAAAGLIALVVLAFAIRRRTRR